jgi:hypothetical protein
MLDAQFVAELRVAYMGCSVVKEGNFQDVARVHVAMQSAVQVYACIV